MISKYLDFLKSDDFLRPLGIPAGTELEFSVLGQGEYNLNYAFTNPISGEKLVLRINTGSQMYLDDQIGYEYGALQALAPSGRTPKPICCWPEQKMLVMAWLPGRALQYETDLPIAAQILADIHSTPVPTDCGLLRPDYPARAIYEECLQMVQHYFDWEEADPEVTDLLLRFGKTVTAFDTPMVLVRGAGLTLGQRLCKRTLDLVLTLVALIPAAPVMALVALFIRLEDGGPVFYRQKRMTQNGREFDILKFRSMIPNAEKYSGAVLASENDPRITKVGRFIRATRLDELPQLLNILKGDMSIVGPRPERREIAERYRQELPEFDYRLKVPGGLTGYAQIYGKYNTTPADKLRLDLIYIEN